VALLAAAGGGDACALDGPAAALRSLDTAFIMGAPPEVVQPFVDVVEPLVPRAARLRGDGQQETLLPRTLPPAAAPALREGHELRRLDAASQGAFRKEYYNVDKPVVLAGVAGASACMASCTGGSSCAKQLRLAAAAAQPAGRRWTSGATWAGGRRSLATAACRWKSARTRTARGMRRLLT
jgi:hypothetical protein